MELIRNNIFETNSSSTHSLVLLKKEKELPNRIRRKNYRGEYFEDVTQDHPNIRVVCGTFRDGGKYSGRIVPIFNMDKVNNSNIYDNIDYSHFKTKLSSIEENASYIFTYLQINYFDTYDMDEKKKIEDLLSTLHERFLDLNLHPIYQMPDIEYHPYDYNYDGKYEEASCTTAWLMDISIEHNDGGFVENLNDIKEILKTKESFKDYLTKYKIKMKYDG